MPVAVATHKINQILNLGLAPQKYKSYLILLACTLRPIEQIVSC